MTSSVCVYLGEELARYHFGADHPFGPKRYDAFHDGLKQSGLLSRVNVCQPVMANENQLRLFHSADYIEQVKKQSIRGEGYLDLGDTPAFKGVFEAASTVVGTTLAAAENILTGECKRAFVPIAGLHHARRERAAGFCVFNDCGVLIEYLRQQHEVVRVAYVDIDAHHGDGVFYGFEDDARLLFADMHEDGRYLYPGTGAANETGTGEAAGTKLNIPMAPGADDAAFLSAWECVEEYLVQGRPQFIILQCGADSLAGDPITHLNYSANSHAHAAQRLCQLADQYCAGRFIALGGGGYRLENISAAWCAVVRAMLS
ncbi:acetoin utilization protein AcuC [Kaarinaea lacus]